MCHPSLAPQCMRTRGKTAVKKCRDRLSHIHQYFGGREHFLSTALGDACDEGAQYTGPATKAWQARSLIRP